MSLIMLISWYYNLASFAQQKSSPQHSEPIGQPHFPSINSNFLNLKGTAARIKLQKIAIMRIRINEFFCIMNLIGLWVRIISYENSLMVHLE
ncbi:hypothetical protein Glove_19g188 [Diversispora epigaea]|uniref:Uncharacterized protein n=1 Tax=Diversispora epigaea TaxID=1348612 RepID=A0A397JUW2_9GLOM|nr:hypothetical protein Glove_19g188 [Diversispora epigaea]